MATESLPDRAARAWGQFRSSLLYYPTLMTAAAVVVFAATSAVDTTLWDEWRGDQIEVGLEPLDFIVFGGSAEAASSVLSTVAGTWATIAGVVFSITLVTLQLSATKYSAQVIPAFERDRLNQVVLGAFASTVVYSLLVLKTVRHQGAGGPTGEFVPIVGVNVAIVAAVVSLFLFIAFIGNVTSYIRPTKFVEGVAADAIEGLPETRRPEGLDGFRALSPPPRPVNALRLPREATRVRTTGSGFVRDVDWDEVRSALVDWSKRDGDTLPRRVVVVVDPGTRVQEGDVLFAVMGGESAGSERHERLRDSVTLVNVRDVEGDPKFATESLADVAITAMSGGATDTGVAASAAAAIVRIAREDLTLPPSRSRFLLTVGGREVEVERSLDRVHGVALMQAKRAADKASAMGYWFVTEAIFSQVDGLLVAAARSGVDEAWQDVLSWVRKVLAVALDLPDPGSKARIVRRLQAARDTLEASGHGAEAAELAYAMEDAASGRELPPEVLAAFAEPPGY